MLTWLGPCINFFLYFSHFKCFPTSMSNFPSPVSLLTSTSTSSFAHLNCPTHYCSLSLPPKPSFPFHPSGILFWIYLWIHLLVRSPHSPMSSTTILIHRKIGISHPEALNGALSLGALLHADLHNRISIPVRVTRFVATKEIKIWYSRKNIFQRDIFPYLETEEKVGCGEMV